MFAGRAEVVKYIKGVCGRASEFDVDEYHHGAVL